MGRRQSEIFKLFNRIPNTPTAKGNVTKFICKYCTWVTVLNSTRMKKHIIQCVNCPERMKAACCVASTTRAKRQETVEAVASIEVLFDASVLPEEHVIVTAPQPGTSGNTTGRSLLRTSTSTASTIPIGMPRADEEECNILLCRALYSTATPLNLLEDQNWQEFFALLRPDWKPPSLALISTKYLDAEYERISALVTEKITEAKSVCLKLHIENRKIHVVVTTPDPVFFKTIPKAGPNGIADFISEIIEEVGSQKVFGMVMDNSDAIRDALGIVAAQYPHVNTYGCVAKALSSLSLALLQLQSIRDVISSAYAMVQEMLISQEISAFLTDFHSQRGTKSTLKLPSGTQLRPTVTFVKNVLDNKDAMKQAGVHDCDSKKSVLSDVSKLNLTGDDFWADVEGLYRLLSPISKWIKSIDSDAPQMSAVSKMLCEIRREVTAAVESSFTSDRDWILRCLEEATGLCQTSLHKAANMLDPRIRGEDLSSEDVLDIAEFLSQTADEDEAEVLAEFAMFRTKSSWWGKEFLWRSAEMIPADTWWQGICPSKHLSKVAVKVVTAPTTSSAWQRTDERDRTLTRSQDRKLRFVRYNLWLQHPASQLPEDDEEEEEETSEPQFWNVEYLEDQ